MTAFSPPPPPAPVKKSGCWKWGLIGCAAALIIAVAGVAGIMMLVFGVIKSSDVYRGARLSAQRDPRVIEALGAPVHTGFWVIGSVHVDNSAGEADITFPLIGSRKRGSVHAVATRSGGQWHYSEMTVTPRDGPTIDLLAP